MRLHHIQVSCREGEEDAARAFYASTLRIPEVPKPLALAGRGGAWFRSAQCEVHVGVEDEFRPAQKAHPAFEVDDIDEVAARMRAAGHDVTWDHDFPGYRRFYTADGSGNRVEILASQP